MFVCRELTWLAYVLPKCRLISVSANFGHSIRHVFSKGHAEILYDLDACMILNLLLIPHAGDHGGWKDRG
jgi:hypothetical protein